MQKQWTRADIENSTNLNPVIKTLLLKKYDAAVEATVKAFWGEGTQPAGAIEGLSELAKTPFEKSTLEKPQK